MPYFSISNEIISSDTKVILVNCKRHAFAFIFAHTVFFFFIERTMNMKSAQRHRLTHQKKSNDTQANDGSVGGGGNVNRKENDENKKRIKRMKWIKFH